MLCTPLTSATVWVLPLLSSSWHCRERLPEASGAVRLKVLVYTTGAVAGGLVLVLPRQFRIVSPPLVAKRTEMVSRLPPGEVPSTPCPGAHATGDVSSGR